MGMRVNPDMYSIILNGLQVNTQQEDQALQQVSSGQKLNSLSDNPAAAASVVNLGDAVQFRIPNTCRTFPRT